jgi:hypothetical protein
MRKIRAAGKNGHSLTVHGWECPRKAMISGFSLALMFSMRAVTCSSGQNAPYGRALNSLQVMILQVERSKLDTCQND